MAERLLKADPSIQTALGGTLAMIHGLSVHRHEDELRMDFMEMVSIPGLPLQDRVDLTYARQDVHGLPCHSSIVDLFGDE